MRRAITHCPHCGSNSGLYSAFTGVQYYKFNGEPDGYDETMGREGKTLRCRACQRIVCRISTLKKQQGVQP